MENLAMRLLRTLNSFRTRLLILLAALLVATLGVQYYVNYRMELRNATIVAEQEQALAVGVELAVESISSRDRISELYEEGRHPLLTRYRQTGRIVDIFIIDEQMLIQDSLNDRYNPTRIDDERLRFLTLKEVPLPRLVLPLGRMVDTSHGSVSVAQDATEPRAFPFPVQTNRGLYYIIVVLGSADLAAENLRRASAKPLWLTFAVLLAATIVAAVLVWRFTRPIKELASAARRVAGGEFNFQVPSARRRDEIGELSRVFNEMIEKLSHTRELEARLHQAERSAVVGRLASAIAHEIRNPLNYINLTLDHVRQTLAPDDPKKKELFGRLADQLKAEVARINTRISEFLSYSRPVPLSLQPVNVRKLIEETLSMVDVDATENGIELRLEQSEDFPEVLGDRESLRSVFTNLIINGLQAIDGKGGRLTVRLTNPGGDAQIEVSDTGGGIPSENISQIFEPYFSTKETGTGLGLAIVKKAVDDHGGTITVRSREGEGTVFTVRLIPAEEDAGGRTS
jgi:signal transduction histidine kinase